MDIKVESFDESSAPELDKIKIGEAKLDLKSDNVGDRRRKSGASRNLPELEVEELKGFIDLEFVFSDEEVGEGIGECDWGFDETTTLASLLMLYLSEAWDRMEEEERLGKNPLVDWRIPTFGNEVELKDHLGLWAHSIASSMR
ncbi:uncharacterized protein LOC131025498 [Salvia miltiorrhiza]|uniref:uncharacterized protein LOC131025498 n=1 Tax=Salvia miltiorrhiza TaxID=226208 RepID=UPI0025AB9783|nr:uncharacterized protein LOC131025498 [Salvia miltiorrhiza]